MKIRAVAESIIAEVFEVTESEGGLILPGNNSHTKMAKILQIGPDVKDSPVEVGDIVYHGPSVRVTLPTGQAVMILFKESIQAVLDL